MSGSSYRNAMTFQKIYITVHTFPHWEWDCAMGSNYQIILPVYLQCGSWLHKSVQVQCCLCEERSNDHGSNDNDMPSRCLCPVPVGRSPAGNVRRPPGARALNTNIFHVKIRRVANFFLNTWCYGNSFTQFSPFRPLTLIFYIVFFTQHKRHNVDLTDQTFFCEIKQNITKTFTDSDT